MPPVTISAPYTAHEYAELKQRKLHQFVLKYQAIFFFPVLSLIALSLQASSVRFLILKKEKYHSIEVALVALHFAAYLGILCFFLGIWQTVLFIAVHQLLFGLYLGSIFCSGRTRKFSSTCITSVLHCGQHAPREKNDPFCSSVRNRDFQALLQVALRGRHGILP
jgi:hypothetical protein